MYLTNSWLDSENRSSDSWFECRFDNHGFYTFNWQDRIVQLFESNTYSVVNIFDVTLRPQLNVTGVVEVTWNSINTNMWLSSLFIIIILSLVYKNDIW